MLSQLRLSSQEISLEAASGEAAFSSAVDKLPSFVDRAKAFFEERIKEPLCQLFVKKDLAWMGKQLSKIPYIALRPLTVYVPPGMTGTYLAYVSALEEAAKHVKDVRSGTLSPLNSWLRTNLGRPSGLASVTSSLKISNFDEKIGSGLRASLAELTNEHRGQSVTTTFGKAFDNNAQFTAVVDKLGKLAEQFGDEKAQTQIRDEMAETSELLQKLVARIHADPEKYKLSPTTLTALSQAVHDAASQVDFYGQLAYRVNAAVEALRRTQESLSKLDLEG